MSKKFYLLFLLAFLYAVNCFSQICSTFSATAETVESRCAATGKIIITVLNGSGTYNYSVTGPVSTPYTSSDTIDGLPAGAYDVFVKDIVNNCFYTIPNVIVSGSYQDPRFELLKTNVTCFNGNNGTITVNNVQYGRPPFNYTIVAPSTFGIGTGSATGVFTNLVPGSYFIQQRDSCGGIQTRNISILNYDWFFDQYSVTKVTCDSSDIYIRLKDIYGKLNTADTIFSGFIYGAVTPLGDTIFSNNYQFRIQLGNFRSLKLFAKDKCGNIKTVNWVNNNTPRVATAVNELNKECNFFSARITDQQNLTDPNYCLYDSSNNLITCNSTGQFDSLAYGSYCIRITDVCYDTIINRCFTAVKPVPSVAANVTVTYGDDCNVVTVSINGQSNLNNPQFCLYDRLDVLIACNTTGTFGNVPIGNYCMKITGTLCNDTTLIRCFTIVPLPVGPGTGPEFSNFTCNTFTGTITGTTGLGNATYCLYDSSNLLLRCNTTGIFDSLAFGAYCITIQVSRINGGCADTLFPRCFTVSKPVPAVSDVQITKTCSTFNASIATYQNLINPLFCLYQKNTLIACNSTGVFDSLAFGKYCINVTDSCSDSTIVKCFDVKPDTVEIAVSAKPSCSLDETKITVTIATGVSPYIVEVFDHLGILIRTISTNNTQIDIDSLPSLPLNETYKIVVLDVCGNMATSFIAPVAAYLTKSIVLKKNCPGGSFTQGSADIEITLNSNISKATPVIIKRDGSTVNFTYSFSNSSQTVFTFKTLKPAVYIIRSRLNNTCNITVYDTVTITAYQYPSLQNSSLYRCDDNSFNITAITTGGIAPVTYEIIGSVPSAPSIITPPQSSPAFSINNGTAYTLVRLRVLDACSNASINDISTVPLVNFIITSVGGCFNEEAILKVDSTAGATYAWYKKTSAVDSTFIGSNSSYYIPVVTASDTAMYLCKVVLNTGCITRLAYFHVTGFCDILLPDANIKLEGKKSGDDVLISWKVNNENGIKEYVVERKRKNENQFTAIHQQKVKSTNGSYSTTDTKPGYYTMNYRIRILKENGDVTYSNFITVKSGFSQSDMIIYPNPVKNTFTIQLKNITAKEIIYRLTNLNGKVIEQKKLYILPQQNISLERPPFALKGMYLLSIIDVQSNTTTTQKLVFQ